MAVSHFEQPYCSRFGSNKQTFDVLEFMTAFYSAWLQELNQGLLCIIQDYKYSCLHSYIIEMYKLRPRFPSSTIWNSTQTKARGEADYSFGWIQMRGEQMMTKEKAYKETANHDIDTTFIITSNHSRYHPLHCGHAVAMDLGASTHPPCYIPLLHVAIDHHLVLPTSRFGKGIHAVDGGPGLWELDVT
uniref:Uncharacterized protein n=1 Tax=Leersia perrieri TaxID=77586 RepID=A0A0D9XB07_9ORYZ